MELRRFDGPVLITNGSGFIGRHVVAAGKSLGCEIVALDHHSTDLMDYERVREVLRESQPKAILHLAAAGVGYGTTGAADLLKVNSVGLANLFAAVEESKLRPRIVVTGSGFEYALQNRPISEDDAVTPPNLYGVSKAAASMLAAVYATRMPVVLLRPFSVFGPGEGKNRLLPYVMLQTKAGEPVEMTAGEQVRDFTYVADVAEAYWRALQLPESNSLTVLNVASGVAVTLREFVEEAAVQLRARGFAPDLRFGAKPYRPDEPMCYMADISRMRAAMNWAPPTSWRHGVARTVEAFL